MLLDTKKYQIIYWAEPVGKHGRLIRYERTEYTLCSVARFIARLKADKQLYRLEEIKGVW